MEPLEYLIICLAAMPNSISLAILYDALFERHLRKSLHWICLLATIAILCVCLIQIPMGTSLIRVVSFLLTDYLILCLFKGNVLVCMCIATLHYFIATAIETILLPIIITVMKLPLDELLDKIEFMAIAYLTPMIIMFVFCLFFAQVLKRWKEKIELPVWEWLSIFLFELFNLFEVYFAGIIISTNSIYIYLMPILGVVILFMNVGLLLLLNKLASNHRMVQENLVLQEQMRYNLLSMQAATENYDAQRSLTHDFDNHLLTIIQLLQTQQGEEALTYAQTVMTSVAKVDLVVSTNNPIADAVLNQKYRKAQENGVQMQFLVSDLSCFPLATDEMVTVLGNLLDNALEACLRGSCVSKKSIHVKLLMEPSLATLSVQNTSLEVNLPKEGEISTTKSKQAEHGYGLKNCKKILQRSGFDFALQYKNGWFQFTAIKAL